MSQRIFFTGVYLKDADKFQLRQPTLVSHFDIAMPFLAIMAISSTFACHCVLKLSARESKHTEVERSKSLISLIVFAKEALTDSK